MRGWVAGWRSWGDSKTISWWPQSLTNEGVQLGHAAAHCPCAQTIAHTHPHSHTHAHTPTALPDQTDTSHALTLTHTPDSRWGASGNWLNLF